MSDMLETARDAVAQAVDNGLGPHGFYYSLIVNEPEETIELRGVPLTRVAGERYLVAALREVLDGTYQELIPSRVERIKNWMTKKHPEHLVE